MHEAYGWHFEDAITIDEEHVALVVRSDARAEFFALVVIDTEGTVVTVERSSRDGGRIAVHEGRAGLIDASASVFHPAGANPQSVPFPFPEPLWRVPRTAHRRHRRRSGRRTLSSICRHLAISRLTMYGLGAKLIPGANDPDCDVFARASKSARRVVEILKGDGQNIGDSPDLNRRIVECINHALRQADGIPLLASLASLTTRWNETRNQLSLFGVAPRDERLGELEAASSRDCTRTLHLVFQRSAMRHICEGQLELKPIIRDACVDSLVRMIVDTKRGLMEECRAEWVFSHRQELRDRFATVDEDIASELVRRPDARRLTPPGVVPLTPVTDLLGKQ